MTTGHLNPGYGNIVSNMRRYHSALQCDGQKFKDLQTMGEDYSLLESIKNQAKDVWMKPDYHQTTYGDHYNNKMVEIDELTRSRPSSAQRRNNPHPPLVFLSTRLHHVPGYHNPDAVLGKDVYRVDASVPSDERAKRVQMRSKYIGRPSSAAVNQYKTNENLEHITDPVERQATQAWIKLANDKDKENFARSGELFNARGPAMVRTYRPSTVPSLHRYLREAGFEEAERLGELNQKAQSGFYCPPATKNMHSDLGTRRYEDIMKIKNARYTHQSKRGDFLMHPEWTPNMPHHRLNGLSSVDLPYIPGRR